jgi:hypothetical protein
MPKHIDNLLGAINKRDGYAHPNRFTIEFPELRDIISPDNARDFEFFCESTSIPGRQILTNDYSATRQAEKRPNGYANEDVNFVFNLTNDYFIRDIFNRWTNEIVDRDTYEVGYRSDYSIDIDIHQLDEEDNKVYTCTLKDAFPVTVQNIDLNNTTESSVQKLNVTMAYRDFEERKRFRIPGKRTALPNPANVKQDRTPSGGPLPDRANVIQNREPSGGPLPNPADVIQKRREIPTIVPFLPPKINRINRIARIFGIIPGPQ